MSLNPDPSFLVAYTYLAACLRQYETERQWGRGVMLLLVVVVRRRRRRREGMGEQGEMGE